MAVFASALLSVLPAAAGLPIPPAVGQLLGSELYGIMQDGSFVGVDSSCGDATRLLLSEGVPRNIQALAYDPGADALYGIVDAGSDPKLARVDRATGVPTVIGPIDTPGVDWINAESLAFNEADGKLYAAGGPRHSYSERLATVDVATGAGTLVASVTGTRDGGDADAMEFVDGVLFVEDGVAAYDASFLYRLDLATGIAALVGRMHHPAIDIAHDAGSQLLYGTSVLTREVFTVSLADGHTTLVGETHAAGEFGGLLFGLASAPPATVLHAVQFPANHVAACLFGLRQLI